MKISRVLVRYLNTNYPVLTAKLRFWKNFKRFPDFKNPKNLNEKILWMSLFSDTTLWSKCSDKYRVRDYIEEKGLGDILVPLYGKWVEPDDINWDELPKSFVLKTNNGCGTVLVIDDKNNYNEQDVKNRLKEWLKKKLWLTTTEYHYKNIPPCIIAEGLLIPDSEDAKYSSTIIDYKIWCFDGKADSILVCSNRRNDGCDLSVFDTKWNYRRDASVFDKHHTERNQSLPKPNNLERMIEIAEILSKGFPEVRVDLYSIGGKIYFGELTFSSLGGLMTYYTDEELSRMGSLVDITKQPTKV